MRCTDNSKTNRSQERLAEYTGQKRSGFPHPCHVSRVFRILNTLGETPQNCEVALRADRIVQVHPHRHEGAMHGFVSRFLRNLFQKGHVARPEIAKVNSILCHSVPPLSGGRALCLSWFQPSSRASFLVVVRLAVLFLQDRGPLDYRRGKSPAPPT